MTLGTLQIGARAVGHGQPCFVIAEAGVNHNGDLALANRLVDIAAEAGADAVKFQTFRADAIASRTAPKARYQLDVTSRDESQLEMLRKLELTPEMHRAVSAHCRAKGILFLSTPFDEASADFLDELGVVAFKMASGEITNLPFVAHVARKVKPMLVSTGMSNIAEVAEALRTIAENGNPPTLLFQCTSNYPAAPSDINLRAMQTMSHAFGVPVGYSDHTAGIEISLAAVALGACILEKHFTIDRNLPGPDHKASLEPAELGALVRGVRAVEAALGHGRKEPVANELSTRDIARKSLVATRDIARGSVIGENDVVRLRPGTGISASRAPTVLGRKLKSDIAAGTMFAWDMFE